VDSDFVREGHHPQHAPLQLCNLSPEPIAVFLLRFASDGILQNPDAPLLLEIGALPQDLILEVGREPIRRHACDYSALSTKSLVGPNAHGERRGAVGRVRSTEGLGGYIGVGPAPYFGCATPAAEVGP
jgi:hypothetical protein